ncbi:MAG TPA: DegV family protein [Bacilli bacterium]|nr:DegV family protein [Bacilli bacterium]
MQNYVIITDATCDLPIWISKKFALEVIPMVYQMEGKDFQIDITNPNFKLSEFYAKLRQGQMATTTQINAHQYEEVIEKYLAQGIDVLVINFSSALSGSFNSLNIAKRTLDEKYPQRQLIIFDSKAASMGEGLLVYLALLEKQKGKTITEVAAWLSANYLHLCHWFIVDDLDFLRRGGRLSGSIAFIGRLLKIKPILHVDNDGRLVSVKKAIGKNRALEELFQKLVETGINPNKQTIFISHGDALTDATNLKNLILARFPQAQIVIGEIGAIIGAHSGPGTVALFFLGTER